MSTVHLSVREFGSVTVRHLFDFDALVEEARRAGIDAHPNVVARNWAMTPQRSVNIIALAVDLKTPFSVGSARAALASEGLRPCTPHETLCIAIDHGPKIGEKPYLLSLGHVWQAKDGETVLVTWRSVGRPRVGSCIVPGHWSGEGGWNLLATVAD